MKLLHVSGPVSGGYSGYSLKVQLPISWRPYYYIVTPAPTPQPTVDPCDTYAETDNCMWTLNWNCPGQPDGRKGYAANDSSPGYNCCCGREMWKQTRAPVTVSQPS